VSQIGTLIQTLAKGGPVMGGVAEALIATAAGLAIAIATLVPYNYFQARAEQAMDAMERLAGRLDLARSSP
jgi:biopolymer transport protein ExbB